MEPLKRIPLKTQNHNEIVVFNFTCEKIKTVKHPTKLSKWSVWKSNQWDYCTDVQEFIKNGIIKSGSAHTTSKLGLNSLKKKKKEHEALLFREVFAHNGAITPKSMWY